MNYQLLVQGYINYLLLLNIQVVVVVRTARGLLLLPQHYMCIYLLLQAVVFYCLILLFPPLAALFPVQEEEDVFGWWCPCTRWILEFRCSTLGIVGNSFVKLCSDVPIAASIAKCKLLILFILRPVR